ncbi:hypothetical protein TNCV_1178601 [Trichonephila clavipes]|nr:hypothetical protein TNCV_1178601 [Trichonephila clavipes]
MCVGENQIAGDETDGGNGIAAGENQNDRAGDEIDGENGMAVYQNDMTADAGENEVADMAEWRREQLDKTKKKRPAEENARDAKKMATEDED